MYSIGYWNEYILLFFVKKNKEIFFSECFLVEAPRGYGPNSSEPY
jgi:hypothetical protein